MSQPLDVRVLASRVVYTGRIFRVVEEALRFPSGREVEIATVQHAGAVAIAAVEDDGRMLLVRQYRRGPDQWMLEVPAGRIELGESPLHAAQRELEEETQHRARSWTELASFYATPGFCSERLTLFAARGLERIERGARAADPDEEIELVRKHPSEYLRDGCFDAKSLIAALLLSKEPASGSQD
jgi:ADP-ribose pyrophosphatase